MHVHYSRGAPAKYMHWGTQSCGAAALAIAVAIAMAEAVQPADVVTSSSVASFGWPLGEPAMCVVGESVRVCDHCDAGTARPGCDAARQGLRGARCV